MCVALIKRPAVASALDKLVATSFFAEQRNNWRVENYLVYVNLSTFS